MRRDRPDPCTQGAPSTRTTPQAPNRIWIPIGSLAPHRRDFTAVAKPGEAPPPTTQFEADRPHDSTAKLAREDAPIHLISI